MDFKLLRDAIFSADPGDLGFPGGSDGKESTCNAGDLGSIPGLGRSPGGGHGNPLQYAGLENPRGEERLAGYSPWDRKESDTRRNWATKLRESGEVDPLGDLLTICTILLGLFKCLYIN